MKTWKCSLCGYVHEGETPPEKCPLCGAPAEKFVEVQTEESETDLSEIKEVGKWKCSVCGHEHEGEGLPEKCPLCGVSSDKFNRINDVEKVKDTQEPASIVQDSTWKCGVCGHIHTGSEPPEKCPLCGVPSEKFVQLEDEAENPEQPVEMKEEPALVQQKKTLFDFIRKQFLGHHIHPISVHFPNGILPATLVFLAIAVFFNVAGLELAALFNLVFVLVNMPIVMFSGYLEWQSRYQGATTLLFKTKIASSVVVLTCLTWLIGWRIINPEIIVQASPERWVYLVIATIMVSAAGVAGHLGGKLVFGGRD